MFKLGLICLAIIVLLSVYIVGNNYIVHTSDGYQLVEKKEFALGGTMQDTTKWGPTDWFKNPQITKAVAKEKWADVKEAVSEGWSDFSKSLDRQAKSLDLDKLPEKAKAEYEDLRKTVEKKYEKLSKKLHDKKITAAEFQEKVNELNEWAAKELEAIKKHFS